MFDHVTIRVSDRAESERFYGAVLSTLGIARTYAGADFLEWGELSLIQGPPVTRGLHVAFGAASRELVHAFWQAGIDAGCDDDGPPGPRTEYGPDYYGGFLRDPDGNSVEAVHDSRLREGVIDHLWLRVADLEAAREFYEALGPHAGFTRVGGGERPRRHRFAGAAGSFSVVEGEPTTNLHVAFPADADDAVDRFHRAMTAAGHRDNGAPGERAAYHRGYYAAFVLDPDGNNVELVNHNR